MNTPLQVHPRVQKALRSGGAVVALESTIIAHGMPWPRNFETALAVEAAVRERDAVPATVAVIGGRLCVGLDEAEIERIARAGSDVVKCSRRDLPVVLAAGGLGATTVAGTLIAATAAGIPVFATGGIGGVHRGAGSTFDVSADLPELARSPVVTVCAGAKSILDLAGTLEWLETRGVPVVGVGTDEFPAFYARESGLPLEARVDSPEALAAMYRAQRALGGSEGIVAAVPIPASDEADFAAIRDATERALAESVERGLRGKAITPFLLARIEEITGGDSLDANVRLVLRNARFAAELAGALRPGNPGNG